MFPLFPHLFAMKWWDWMPWSLFFEYWILSQLFHSPLSLSSRDSQESSPTPQFKSISSLVLSFLYGPTLSHLYMITGKTIALTWRTFVDKVMSLLFNMLSSLVITFLPRNKNLLISWLQSPSAVILEPPLLSFVILWNQYKSIRYKPPAQDSPQFPGNYIMSWPTDRW